MSNPFSVNYSNLEEIIAYAKTLDSERNPMAVVKYEDRPNYNIMHLVNYMNRKPDCKLVWVRGL